MTLEAILTNRNQLSEDILRDLQGVAAGYGVEILRADVKDIVFPGNLQDIMNRVLAAERLSEAQLVEARTKAETAALDARSRAESERVAAATRAEATRLAAEAEAEAQRIRTAAEVEALRRQAEARRGVRPSPGPAAAARAGGAVGAGPQRPGAHLRRLRQAHAAPADDRRPEVSRVRVSPDASRRARWLTGVE